MIQKPRGGNAVEVLKVLEKTLSISWQESLTPMKQAITKFLPLAGSNPRLFEETLNKMIEDGEFEVLDFHKPIMSHLKEGTIVVDNFNEIPIRGGVVKMGGQKLVAIVEV